MCSPNAHSTLRRHGSTLLDPISHNPQNGRVTGHSPSSLQASPLFQDSCDTSLGKRAVFADFRPGSQGGIETRLESHPQTGRVTGHSPSSLQAPQPFQDSSGNSLGKRAVFADFRPGSRGGIETRLESRCVTDSRGDIGSRGSSRPRPFGTAGRSLTTSHTALPSMPVMELSCASSTRGDEDDDDDQDGFLREARALIKDRSERASMRPQCRPAEPSPLSKSGSTGFIGLRRFQDEECSAAKSQKTQDTSPWFQNPSRSSEHLDAKKSGIADSMSIAIERRAEQHLQHKRANAQALMSACYEDLISFLEMSNLSGAYALVFAANGVENLSQLLLLTGDETNDLIARCDLDAIDEILLLEALQHARPSQ